MDLSINQIIDDIDFRNSSDNDIFRFSPSQQHIGSESQTDFDVEDVGEEKNDAVGPIKQKRNYQKRSWIWTHFTSIEQNDVCNYCKKSFRKEMKNSGTTTLIRHLKAAHKNVYDENVSEVNGFTQEKFRGILVEWIVSSDQPFNVTEDQKFVDMITVLNSRAKLVSGDTIKRDIVNLYAIEKSKMKTKLMENKGKLSFSLDCWTSGNNLSFLGVTVHYIDGNWTSKNHLLDFKEVIGKHEGELLSQQFVQIIKDFDIPFRKIHGITIDNASNNGTMMTFLCMESDLINKNHRIKCFAHIINLSVQDLLKDLNENNTDGQYTLSKVKKIVNYVRGSPQRQKRFFNVCIEVGLKELNLIVDVKTRWDSVHDMLDRLQNMKKAVVKFLDDEGQTDMVLDEIEWTLLQELCSVLSKFRFATKHCSQQDYPTISSTLALYIWLKNTLEKLKEKHVALSSSIMIAQLKLDKYYDQDKSTFLTIAMSSVFLEKDSDVHQAFQLAIKSVKNSSLNETDIEFDIQYVSQHDYFHLYTRACVEIGYGVAALFGPSEPQLDLQLQSLSNNLGIPLISTAPRPLFSTNAMAAAANDLTIVLHPTQKQLVTMLKDLVEILGWKEISIVHDPLDGIFEPINLAENLQSLGTVSLHQAFQADLRATLVQLRLRGARNIIMNTGSAAVSNILGALLDTGMMSNRYSYIFTMLDMESGNWTRLSFTEALIFGFNILDRTKLNEFYSELGQKKSTLPGTKIGLTIDSVELFSRGLEDFDNSGVDLISSATSCHHLPNGQKSSKKSQKGDHQADASESESVEKIHHRNVGLWDSLRNVQFDGFTGPISFINGIRSKILVDILKLSHNGDGSSPEIVKIGNWSEGVGFSDGIFIEDSTLLSNEEPEVNKTYLITTLPGTSCFFTSERDGKSVNEGLCVDLAEALFSLIGLKYKFKPGGDGQYGKLNEKNGQFDGLVGEIVREEADVALSYLTITAQRQKVVDFTVPFKQTSIGILYKKELDLGKIGLFLKPFNNWVWLSILVSFLVTSFSLCIIGWISPYQRKNDLIISSSSSERSSLGHDLTWVNSIWLLASSFFLRSSHAISSRTIAIVWWIFALLILLVYASLISRWINHDLSSSHVPKTPSEVSQKIDNLLANPAIQFGVLHQGSTHYFLQNAQRPELQNLWWKIEKSTKTQRFQTAISGGIDQVVKSDGDYVFIGEESSLAGSIEDCSLRFLGPIETNSYALAVSKGSLLKEKLSQALLRLREQGVLHKLNQKWSDYERKTGNCDNMGENSPPVLHLLDLIGPLTLLIIGIIFALLFSCGEKIVHYQSTHRGFFRTSTESGNGKIAMNSSHSNSNDD